MQAQFTALMTVARESTMVETVFENRFHLEEMRLWACIRRLSVITAHM